MHIAYSIYAYMHIERMFMVIEVIEIEEVEIEEDEENQ